MEPIYHPYVNENFSALLPQAQSDLLWKETAYKVSEWGLWVLAGVTILGIIVTAVVFPHIISSELAYSIIPAFTLVFALSEMRTIWSSNVVTPRYTAFIKAKNRAQELQLLTERQNELAFSSPQQLKAKVTSFGLDPSRVLLDRSLIARYTFYAHQAESAQNEANRLFIDPSKEINYYKGYRHEEMIALASKVHAAAMLHLMVHPEETRSLEELAPLTPQRFDERARINKVSFGGEYLSGIPREFIRFGSIREIAARLFGT